MNKKYEDFARGFITDMFPPAAGVRPPNWVKECLEDGAGLSISDLYPDWDNRVESSDNPRCL